MKGNFKCRVLLTFIIPAFITFHSHGQSFSFDWAHAVGSSSHDNITKIETDQSGNVYCIGTFTGYNFDADPGIGTQIYHSQGLNDGFISKFDPNGNFIWTKIISGPGSDNFRSLIIDNNDQIWLTGTYSEPFDIDFGLGSFVINPTGYFDFFIAKYDTALNLHWVKNGDKLELESMHLDQNENIYLFLFDRGTADFDFGPGSSVLTGSTIYPIGSVAKYDSTGNFLWARSTNDAIYFRGSIDSSGNVLILSSFENSVDFDPGPGTYNLTSAGSYDITITKLDSAGLFLWAKQIGGSGNDVGWKIITDKSENIILSSIIHDSLDLDPGPLVTNYIVNGSADYALLKLNSNGDLIWPAVFDYAQTSELICDEDENIYTVGLFNTTMDVDLGPGIHELIPLGGNFNVFVLKLYPSGQLNLAYSAESNANMEIYGFHLTENSGLLFSGRFNDTIDFDYGFGAYLVPPPNFSTDAYLAQLHDHTTNIPEPANTNTLIIFPNPVSEILHIQTSNINNIDQLVITDITGKITFQKSGIIGSSFTLPVPNWKPGMYFARITIGNNVQSQKFIIIR